MSADADVAVRVIANRVERPVAAADLQRDPILALGRKRAYRLDEWLISERLDHADEPAVEVLALAAGDQVCELLGMLDGRDARIREDQALARLLEHADPQLRTRVLLVRPLRDRVAPLVPADVGEVLEARAGVGAVAAPVPGLVHLRVVVDLANLDVVAGERAVLLRLAPLPADHLELSGRAVQAVVVLLAAADRGDV